MSIESGVRVILPLSKLESSLSFMKLIDVYFKKQFPSGDNTPIKHGRSLCVVDKSRVRHIFSGFLFESFNAKLQIINICV